MLASTETHDNWDYSQLKRLLLKRAILEQIRRVRAACKHQNRSLGRVQEIAVYGMGKFPGFKSRTALREPISCAIAVAGQNQIRHCSNFKQGYFMNYFMHIPGHVSHVHMHMHPKLHPWSKSFHITFAKGASHRPSAKPPGVLGYQRSRPMVAPWHSSARWKRRASEAS